MSFQTKNFSILAYTGFTMWYYKTSDNLSDVLYKDYFKDAKDMIKNDDMVVINANGKNAIRFFQVYKGFSYSPDNGIVLIEGM